MADFRLGRGVLEIVADSAGLRGEVSRAAREAGAGQSIDIPVKADTSGLWRDLDGKLRDARGRFAKAGTDSGNAFGSSAGKSAGKSFGDFLTRADFLPNLSPAMTALAASIVPATAGMLAFGSSIGLAASSSAALLPALVGAGVTLGTLRLAFDGVGGAVAASAQGTQAYQEALSRLTPAGRQVAEMLVSTRDRLRDIAQETVLPSVARGMESMRGLAPLVTQAFRDMGTQIGSAAETVGELSRTSLFREQLKTILDNNTSAARSLSAATGPLVSGLMSISAAASPLVARFAEAVRGGAEMIANWLEVRRASGELQAFFTSAGDEMAKWWNITKNVLAGIISLFRDAAPAGQAMSSSILSVSESFRSWAGSESTRQSVERLMRFVAGLDVGRMLQLAAAVGALGLAIKGLSAAQGAVGVVSTLAALGPVGLTIGAVVVAVGALAAGLTYLYTSSQQVRDSIGGLGQSFMDNFSKPLGDVRQAIQDVAPVVRDGLIAGIRELSDYLSNHLFPALRQAYDTALPGLRAAFRDVSTAYTEHRAEINQMLSALRTVVSWITDTLVPLIGVRIGAEFRAWGVAIRVVIDILSALVTAVNGVVTAVQWVASAVATAWGGVTGTFSAGYSATAGILDRFRSAVTSAFQDSLSTISSVMSTIGSTVSAGWNAVVGWTTNAMSTIGSVVSSGMNAVRGVVSAILDIVRQLFQIAWDWINQLTNGQLSAMVATIRSWMSNASAAISSTLDAIRAAFSAAWSWLSSTTQSAWSSITSTIRSWLSSISSAVSSTLTSVRSAISSAWDLVLSGTRSAWSSIWSSISSSLNTIRSGITSALAEVRSAISSAWSLVLSGTQTGWNNIRNAVSSAVSGIGTAISNAFHAIPRTVVNALNAVINGANSLISRVNGILPGNPIPTLGSVAVPAGYASGGRVFGPGTGTSDSIPAMLSDGEYVLRAGAVRALQRSYGSGFLDAMNKFDVSGDQSTTVLSPRRYQAGGNVSAVQSFIRSTDPLPYVWGGVGPNGYDCSGLVGEVWNRLTGHPSYRRVFTTANAVSNGGFRSGHGTFTIGLSPSHVVGNLAGLAFEAASSAAGIRVGGSAKSVDAMPAQYYLPQVGGQFVGGGGGSSGPSLTELVTNLFNSAVSGLRGGLPQPGGFVNPLVTGLFDQIVAGLKARASSMAAEVAPSVVSGASRVSNVILGQNMAAARGWTGGQWDSLRQLWERESNWNHLARNPSSGAYGIPQALPGNKMASAGSDWQTNPGTQIRWGLGYIADRYGTPSSAWGHEVSSGWYDEGGPLPPGPTLAINRTGRTEQVLKPEDIDRLLVAATGTGAPTYNFAPGAITLDASKVEDVRQLIEMINGITSTARQFGGVS